MMNRARLTVAASLIGSALLTGAPPAQAQSSMPSVLAGKKFTPPLKGQAELEYTAPVTRREKDMVVTRIAVRNIHVSAPIARLVIDETWYAKDGSVVTRGRGAISGLLQPGEIQVITIETPWNAKMNGNNYNFSHANGTVKPNRVAKLDAPKTGTASATSTAGGGTATTTSSTSKPATTSSTSKPATATSTSKPATATSTNKP